MGDVGAATTQIGVTDLYFGRKTCIQNAQPEAKTA